MRRKAVHWTQPKIAEMLGLAPQRIQQLRAEGMPWIPNEDGSASKQGAPVKMDPRAVIDWMIDREVAKHQVKAEASGQVTQQEADRLKTIAEWRIKQAQADYDDGIALNAADVLKVWDEMLITYRAQNEAIAGRLAKQLAVIDDPAEIRQRILIEARRACAAAANIAAVFLEAKGKAISTKATTG